MNRRELLTGAALLAGAGQANAFGIGGMGRRLGRGGLLGGASSPYLGPVSNRLWQPTRKTAHVYVNTQSWHVARDNFTSVTVEIPNWFTNFAGSYAETGTGLAATVSASIGDAGGNYSQIALNQTIADGFKGRFTGSTSITSGQVFTVRIWGNFPGGVPYMNLIDKPNGDRFETSATTLADKTMIGGVGVAQSGAMLFPSAVLGMTRKGTVYLCSDSRGESQIDTFDASGDMGPIGRALGAAGIAYINGGVSGRALNNFVASNARQLELAANCKTMVLWQLRNDLSAGRNVSQMSADITTAAGLFPNHRRIICTEPNRTLSTVSISALTSVTTTATATIASTAALVNGQSVVVSGATPAAYNGTYSITVLNSTQFTYTFAGGTSPATGTILVSNQYADATFQSNFSAGGTTNRATMNGLIRGPYTGFHAFWELSTPVEDPGDNTKWITNGTANYATSDGVHGQPAGILLQKASVNVADVR